jgi:hypothetical protein
MVVYIAAHSPLPLIQWQQDSPAFNVTELTEQEERVRRHLVLPHIRQAGSHTSCGCGFNEGRDYPEAYPASERAESLESSSRLARYVIEHRVDQMYSCWSGDEGEPQVFERRITPASLVAEDFCFRERELLVVAHDAA